MGIGSAGQVLQVNSGATAPEWVNNVGGLVLIATFDANNTDKIDITGLTTAYDSYYIVFSSMHPVTDDVYPQLQFGDSSGIDIGTNDYAYSSGSPTNYLTDNSAPSIIMSNYTSTNNKVGNATGQGWSGTGTLHMNLDQTDACLLYTSDAADE